MTDNYRDYFAIKRDLSGSRTQNRFKYQRYWGISKLYQLYNDKCDFILIFDYACDIDVIVDNQFHFYQVKTSSKDRFNLRDLIFKDKKTGISLLSKLADYELIAKTKSICLVVNCSLSEKHKDGLILECLCLNDLEQQNRQKLIDHMEKDFAKQIDLRKYFYQKSDLCLNSSYQTLLGHTVEFLEKKAKTGASRAKYFLDWLLTISEEKSTYEFDVDDKELLKKGIDKAEFSNLLVDYDKHHNHLIEDVQKVINMHYDIYEIAELTRSLTELQVANLSQKRCSIALSLVNEFILFKKEQLKNLSEKQIIELITDQLELDSSFNDKEKKCIIIIGIVKFKGGTNE